jgi:hypothetical protein
MSSYVLPAKPLIAFVTFEKEKERERERERETDRGRARGFFVNDQHA